ncbi:cupin [Sphingobium sp.]|uniref:cupin n=1 Tax=Sphingobium sp. TaxID=1912891 RepID=UPI002CCB6C88|nr:cupin [Sphingobium sp.]HUD95054.1 cupin [Sphingobium sp.]
MAKGSEVEVETYRLAEHGWVPNNARLPVIIYQHALKGGSCEEMAALFEATFANHGWPAQWRDGIYDYHHYHSTANEVLGVAAGSAQLIIGGPEARAVEVDAGDALLLPAGAGHCCARSGSNFLVVDGYPDGQKWDVFRDASDADARRRMAALPFPKIDPVRGINGPLSNRWR